MKRHANCALIIATALISVTTHAAKVDSLLSYSLPAIPPGNEVQMLTVTYEPGESSPPHRHDAHVFVYVLEGSIVMQVKGGKATTLNAGDIFNEIPTDVHLVSANASNSERAKFLVYMIKEKGAPVTKLLEKSAIHQ